NTFLPKISIGGMAIVTDLIARHFDLLNRITHSVSILSSILSYGLGKSYSIRQRYPIPPLSWNKNYGVMSTKYAMLILEYYCHIFILCWTFLSLFIRCI